MATRLIYGCAILLILGGCSSKPKRVMPPQISAEEAGQAAVAEYDTNSDGLIGGEELKKAVGLNAALAKVDQNNDSQISADEVASRIKAWQESKIGIMSLPLRVTLDGKPLENVTVTIIPEKFLGANVKPATGQLGPGGSGSLTVDDPDLKARRLYGAQTGFYKVEITGGSKPLPSKYNTDTTLGVEVAQDAPWVQQGLLFELKSK